ncbi:uncharacterized protein LOC116945818 [Petromyzon marinus]|uniref:uncharacterized protein LOC116945818 n=1 Tax=Petromyzon marinus TaxID=7757 RepID=UPI003F72FEAC
MKQMNVLAKALYDNVAESPDELAFRKGDIVTVLEQNAGGLQGWWLCSLHGRQGVAPGNRLRLLVGCYEGGGTGGAGGGAAAARQTCAANAGSERGGFRSQPQEDVYRVPPSPGSAQGLYRVPPSQGVYNVPPAAPGSGSGGGGQALYQVPPSLAESRDDVYQVPPCSSSAAAGDGPHDAGRDVYQVPPSLAAQDVYQVPPSLAAQDVYQVPPSLEAPRAAQTVGGAGQRGGPQARLSPTRRGGGGATDGVAPPTPDRNPSGGGSGGGVGQDSCRVHAGEASPRMSSDDVYDVPPSLGCATPPRPNTRTGQAPLHHHLLHHYSNHNQQQQQQHGLHLLASGAGGENELQVYDVLPASGRGGGCGVGQDVYDTPASLGRMVPPVPSMAQQHQQHHHQQQQQHHHQMETMTSVDETYDVPPAFGGRSVQQATSGADGQRQATASNGYPRQQQQQQLRHQPTRNGNHAHTAESRRSSDDEVYDVPALARGTRGETPAPERPPGPVFPYAGTTAAPPPPGQEIYDIPPGLQAPRSEPREALATAVLAATDDAEEDVYDCPKPAVPASADRAAGSGRAGSSEAPVPHGGRATAPDSQAAVAPAAAEASAEAPSASSASQDIYDVPREVYASVRKARSEAALSRDCEYDVPPAASRDAACAEPRSVVPGVGHQAAAAIRASVGRGGGGASSSSSSSAPARASKDVASPHSGSQQQQQQRAAPAAYVGGAHGSSNGPAGPQRGVPVPLGNGLSHGGVVVGHNGAGYGDGGPRRLPGGGGDRPGGIQARPLPSPPPFPSMPCGDGNDSADGSCDPGSDEYDYVHLQAKDDPEPEKTSNGMGPIKDQIELIQVYRFEGGPSQPAAGSAAPLEALCRLPLCAHDRQLLRFYAEQGEAPLRALRSAAESFASRLRGGGGGGDDDPADGPEPAALTPRQLLAHGRAVVLGGHRLAFLADALARGALSAELRAATAALAEAVSERLRAVAASSKAAALRYPTAAGAGAWALRRETEARVGELLQQAHGFHELLTRLAGMATASGHSGP